MCTIVIKDVEWNVYSRRTPAPQEFPIVDKSRTAEQHENIWSKKRRELITGVWSDRLWQRTASSTGVDMTDGRCLAEVPQEAAPTTAFKVFLN